MQSQTSKVLFELGNKPLVKHVLDLLIEVNPAQIIIVGNEKNFKEIKKLVGKKAEVTIQKEKKGTLGAAVTGLKLVREGIENIAFLYSDDTAFYSPQTILNVYKYHLSKKSALTFVSLEIDDASGLGRVIRENGKVTGIVEEKDATKNQKKIKEVNDGVYFVQKTWFEKNNPKIAPSPVTYEYYLTDLIELAIRKDKKVEAYLLKDNEQWHGINTPDEYLRAQQKLSAKLHFMGIAGSGAAAAAAIAQENGFIVGGCDMDPHSAYSKNLTNIKIQKGHSPLHLDGVDKLIVSPAVLINDPNNPELKKAKDLKIPVLTWQEFQGSFLQKEKFVIAVSGAYGKSTTTAMISKVLLDQNLDPTCEVGAKVIDWGTNYKVGSSKYYICEADEYNNNFLAYNPDIALVLNLAWDHPDFFKNRKDVTDSYIKFINRAKRNGTLIINSDQNLKKLLPRIRKDIKIIKIGNFGKINLSIIGKFRKENADAALTLAQILKLNLDKAKKSIESFKGLARRLEYKGNVNKLKVYDDYAVQPYTVRMTANALRQKFPREQMYLIFEPHTFSRIETFFNDFVKSLKGISADKILITDIFAAREKGAKSTLAKKLAARVGDKAVYISSLENAAKYIKNRLKSGIVLSMGAGKAYMLWDIMTSEK